jgi:hypothetical protein
MSIGPVADRDVPLPRPQKRRPDNSGRLIAFRRLGWKMQRDYRLRSRGNSSRRTGPVEGP